jgi:predicted DNA-binding protein
VYLGSLQSPDKSQRQSVSLPPRTVKRVKALAKARRASASRVIAELIESGLEVQERERQRFFELADRLTRSTDLAEQKRLKEELARLTFGA